MEDTILYRPPGNPPPPITKIAVDILNKRLACGNINAQVLLLSAKNGRPRRALSGHEGMISSLAFLDKGARLLTGSWDCTARSWKSAKGVQNESVLSHSSEIKSLNVHEESSKGAAGTRDGIVKIFSLNRLKCIRNLEAHQRDISGISFTSDGAYMLTASWDGSVKLWDMSSFELVKNILRQKHRIRSFDIMHDDGNILAGLHNGSVRIVSIENTRNRSEIKAHSDIVSTLAVSPNGQFLATGSWDRKVKVWDLATKGIIDTGYVETGISDLVWNPQGGQFYTADFSGAVRSWTFDT